MRCWMLRVASRRGVAALLLTVVSLACGSDTVEHEPSLVAADAGAPDAALPVVNVDLSGTWLGTLQVPPAALRFVLNIERADDGGWTGTATAPIRAPSAFPSRTSR